MLDKSMYKSWESRMLLYIKGNKNGRMMLESIKNGPLLQDDCDVQATNIVLQGLPPDVYALVNHSQSAKDIWERVKLLMKGAKENATSSRGNNAAGQARVVKCYNCEGAGHMARKCTKPKRPRNSTWFKEKMLLVQAQESGQVLDEEQLAFLADPGIVDDCDDISSTKAILMPNLSSYGSNVLSEYLQQTQNVIVQDTNSSVQQDAMIIAHANETTSFFMITHKEALGYQNPFYLKKAQRIKPTLYDGSVISRKHDVIYVIDEEEILMLEEESRTKMLAKQNDSISKEKKIYISPINYTELNKLAEDFGKRFVPQKELSVEQAFWLQLSNPKFKKLVITQTPVEIEVPSELPQVSMVETSFQKLKNQLASFDKVVKIRTTPDEITEGSWGFEHTKSVFKQEVIPFIKSL
ncbi:copia protein [Tanacetum coccineum]